MSSNDALMSSNDAVTSSNDAVTQIVSINSKTGDITFSIPSDSALYNYKEGLAVIWLYDYCRLAYVSTAAFCRAIQYFHAYEQYIENRESNMTQQSKSYTLMTKVFACLLLACKTTEEFNHTMDMSWRPRTVNSTDVAELEHTMIEEINILQQLTIPECLSLPSPEFFASTDEQQKYVVLTYIRNNTYHDYFVLKNELLQLTDIFIVALMASLHKLQTISVMQLSDVVKHMLGCILSLSVRMNSEFATLHIYNTLDEHMHAIEGYHCIMMKTEPSDAISTASDSVNKDDVAGVFSDDIIVHSRSIIDEFMYRWFNSEHNSLPEYILRSLTSISKALLQEYLVESDTIQNIVIYNHTFWGVTDTAIDTMFPYIRVCPDTVISTIEKADTYTLDYLIDTYNILTEHSYRDCAKAFAHRGEVKFVQRMFDSDFDKSEIRKIVSRNAYPTMDMLECLIANGCDFTMDASLLIRAIVAQRYDIVVYLCEQGVNIMEHRTDDVLMMSDECPLIVAARVPNIAIIKYIFRNVELSNKELLSYTAKAIYSNNIEAVKYFVDRGINVKERNEVSSFRYRNPLPLVVIASTVRKPEILEYLIEQGVDIHVNDEQALYTAAMCHQYPIIKILLEHGADVYIDDCRIVKEVLDRRDFRMAMYLMVTQCIKTDKFDIPEKILKDNTYGRGRDDAELLSYYPKITDEDVKAIAEHNDDSEYLRELFRKVRERHVIIVPHNSAS